jgi:hypothetical protein
MKTNLRERISIDLMGLKTPLMARSQALGVSPSELVRKALAHALDTPAEAARGEGGRAPWRRAGDSRTRLCLRMAREAAAAALEAAKRAGLSPGDYVAGLVAAVPVLMTGGRPSEHIAALTASTAELASFSRNLYALTRFLTLGNAEQALVCRDMLDTLDHDVRRHLMLASGVLAELGRSGRSGRLQSSRESRRA